MSSGNTSGDLITEVIHVIKAKLSSLNPTELEYSLDQDIFQSYFPIINKRFNNQWTVRTLETCDTFEQAAKFVLIQDALRISQVAYFDKSYAVLQQYVLNGKYDVVLNDYERKILIEMIKDTLAPTLRESLLAYRTQREKDQDMRSNNEAFTPRLPIPAEGEYKDNLDREISNSVVHRSYQRKPTADILRQSLPLLFQEDYDTFVSIWKQCRAYALWLDWIDSGRKSSTVGAVMDIERMNDKKLSDALSNKLDSLKNNMENARRLEIRLTKTLDERMTDINTFVMREPKKAMPKHEKSFFEKLKYALLDW